MRDSAHQVGETHDEWEDVTADLPAEVEAYGEATRGMHPYARGRAHVSGFAQLEVESPLVLTVDDNGWYLISLADPETGEQLTNFVRSDWARDRELEGLGISLARVVLDRYGAHGRRGSSWMCKACIARPVRDAGPP
jgi:hypothetical protein